MGLEKTWVSIIPSKKIPAEFFFDGIHDTEFRKNSVKIPFRRNTEFRNTEFRIP